ncbi:patatin-like phospholipase family protein [Bradyrhizobium erythrophlei]|uniref:NTE family protein n=1 Tax=Bradyrhizobium erythrophlei TaxID=1437360 RepID=A0A1M5JS07_9BRAD|nr:patatin-like phospholipase family protein [Bradyrhizobium erythrophlei]SHG43334.1 NTE family protein [Bradyrhizobium erythrophlei]
MKQAALRPKSYTKKVALVLQGGGALGSYQAGVYEALASSDYKPDWVAGISIGAINAALIAGNSPETRVEKLREFWRAITTPTRWAVPISGLFNGAGLPFDLAKQISAMQALLLGQTNFFAPRKPADWWFGRTPTSYYDTNSLKSTLERLVDFDRINSREIRFSVGAVNVRTGNFVYFDNAEIEIRPEHVLASGALPPGFPSVEIDGEHYWDGGLVSNTPLQHVLEYYPRRSHLIFQVDLFPARGALPRDLNEVGERDKDIRYSSRTRAVTDTLRRQHDLRHSINMLWEKLPDDLRSGAETALLDEFRCVTTMDIVELIYRPEHALGQSKDYEFDRLTMETRWAQGLSDARETLMAAPWLEPMPPEVGARTFDVRAKGPIGDTSKDSLNKAAG